MYAVMEHKDTKKKKKGKDEIDESAFMSMDSPLDEPEVILPAH